MEPLSAADPRMIGGLRIEARLGAGGMGQVYLGFSPAGHAVAVKVVHPELARDGEFLRRFAREAAAAKAVGGVYTAPVVAMGLDDDPPWLATAYVPGPSLADFVARHGPLPEAAVWRLAAGLTEALQAVHGCGLVHRDLKPGNVLLAADGPRVIDFGISRALDGTALTAADKVIGTPGYMSPEHAEGAQAGPASDVFSLGCVLAYAATGNAPYGTGNVASVLYRIVSGQPDLAGVPARLREVITACLAKNPAERPGLTRLAAWISRAESGVPGASPGTFWPAPVAEAIRASQPDPVRTGTATATILIPPTDPGQPPRRPRNKPAVAAALLIVLLAGLTASALNANAPYSRSQQIPSSGQPPSSAPANATQPTLPISSLPVPSVTTPSTPSVAAPSIPSVTTPSTPSDPLAGAWTGECFSNDGSEWSADLQPDPACLDGDFKVVQILADTTDRSDCDGFTGDDWNVSDVADDQVLCFSYLDSSPAYHASVGQCVYGPSDSNTIWSFEPCQAGTFTVVGKYRGTTDMSECGPDMSREFTIGGYPGLDEVLCLRMNFPLLGTVPMNTCLLENGTAGNSSFSLSPCSDANVVVTGRIGVYDDPFFCGTEAAYWWRSNGYPSLGFTTCIRPLN
jgi:serine/threonine protein kinase